MTHEDHGAFYESLEARGVTRRAFLTYCGSVAALLGLGETAGAMIAPAIAAAAEQKLAPAIWLNGGACTGCTESIAQSSDPDVAQIVLDILSMNYIETVMYATGDSAEEAMQQTITENAGKYILIYEGSVMTGLEGNTLRIRNEPSIKQLPEVAKNALAVVAVGSCAVDGGWVRGYPNSAGAIGIQEFLKDNNIATPVVNLPTCPVNPEWVVAMVVDLLLVGGVDEQGKISQAFVDKLDEYGRPKLIFGQTIHDNCPRRGHFENGEFVYKFGSEEEAKGYCLYPVGCKGPQTFTNCPIVRWNDNVSWCVGSGSPCIGCGGYNWVDQNAPFLKRFRQIGLGNGANGGGFAPGMVAGAAAAVVGVGLVAHGVGSAATGRTKGGAPVETEKVWDAKHKKGGGN